LYDTTALLMQICNLLCFSANCIRFLAGYVEDWKIVTCYFSNLRFIFRNRNK